jgi:hypothetical protein
MERKFKLLPPSMPNFVFYEVVPKPREGGFSSNNKFSITDLTEEEAEEFGELMKQTFIEHWKNKKQ